MPHGQSVLVRPVTYLVARITGLSIQNFEFMHNVLIRGAELKIRLAPQLPSSDIDIAYNSVTAASGWPWPSIGIAYSIQGDSTGPMAGFQVVANSVPAPKRGEPFVRAGHGQQRHGGEQRDQRRHRRGHTGQQRVLIQSILQQHCTTDHGYHRPRLLIGPCLRFTCG
jgi:hypothetical protein